ncbi:ATP-binding cassette domain-containing protein [Roseiconus nitratireducens]|uniref:ATP-binding cassette domain-containing protein n=1 Tax=Roseiconus nitratireducens TaxID=2605748 RepID=A0A5M6DLF9_9BACT|nr:ATP-binding cassette domain-containing protein [Roseiconus nitratireducens]KAA5547059.1 ATP-binding cassette domain-containing protein [Roseiconus nitratireducens]
MIAGEPLLTAEDVSRRHASRNLLDQVCLTLRSGDRAALIGSSGSGKSLLLRSLARLEPIDAGTLRWRGEPITPATATEYRSDLIYVAQRPAVFEGTVEANLRIPFALRVHRDRQFDRDAVLEWLAQVGRDESFLDQRGDRLSGGEMQLVALIRAMQLRPSALLLDEPTSSLDPTTADQVTSLITAWHSERPDHRAYLWVTHDWAITRRIADTVYRMRGGSLSVQEDSDG